MNENKVTPAELENFVAAVSARHNAGLRVAEIADGPPDFRKVLNATHARKDRKSPVV